jgi:long-chain acyl-CoA synthetase
VILTKVECCMPDKVWVKHYDPGVRESLEYPDFPLTTFLAKSAERFPQHVCLEYQGQELSYAQVLDSSRRLAAGLLQMGLTQGDAVGLMLPNTPEFGIAYYGILFAGAIVVPLNPVFPYAELKEQCRRAHVKAVIVETERGDIAQRLKQEGFCQSLLLVQNDSNGILQVEKEVYSFQQMIQTDSVFDLPVIPGQKTIAVYQFSGGTTGIPKVIQVSHRNLVANTLQFKEWLVNLHEGQEHFLAAIPLTHVYGMVIALNVGIASGAALHLIREGRDTEKIVQTIQSCSISFFPAVPAIFHSINLHPEVRAGKIDLHSIKACISGSAPLPEEVRKEFERLTGGSLVEGYGLSEAPTATHCNPILGERRNHSIGLPLPDVDCRLLPLTGYPDGEGELLIKSPQVMEGYLENAKETAATVVDGWLHTGDIARMDAEGYFVLVGRKKELIKVGGFQVWPNEVEEVVRRFPGVLDVAVKGIPDFAKGEKVAAWIVTREGSELDTEKLIAFCRNELVHYKVPKEIKILTALPRSAVGKVLKHQLK